MTVALVSLLAIGCEDHPDSVAPVSGGPDRGVVRLENGDHVFYSGTGVGELLADGRTISDDLPTPFMSLTVPSSLVDEAAARPSRVKTWSMEVPDPAIIAHVHAVTDGGVENLTYHAGDPWVTGYAQVGTGSDGYTTGLFEVCYWERIPSGGGTVLAQHIMTTGLLPDDEKPVLKYYGNPVTWPAVPASWK